MQARRPRPRLYNIWICMRQRCRNPKVPGYENYGGRGISISPDWELFPDFEAWAYANGYSHNLTLERQNVDGDYSPQNCCWADTHTQAANKRKRSNTKHRFIGVRPHLSRWRAVIDVEYKQKHLGVFDSEYEAALARDNYIKANSLPHKLNF